MEKVASEYGFVSRALAGSFAAEGSAAVAIVAVVVATVAAVVVIAAAVAATAVAELIVQVQDLVGCVTVAAAEGYVVFASVKYGAVFDVAEPKSFSVVAAATGPFVAVAAALGTALAVAAASAVD